MSAEKFSSWSYTEALPLEDEVLVRARERAQELGVSAVSPGTAALITSIAASSGARNAVEVGTGAGVSTLALLRGLPQDAILTTIDIDIEHLGAARETIADGGFRANRTRIITGKAQDVLNRLTDNAYDLVFIDADKANSVTYVEHACRLLRRGGTLIFNDALDGDRVPQPAIRQPSTTATRQATRYVRDRDDFVTSTVPTGTGVLIGAKRA